MPADLSPSVPAADLDADCVRLAYAHLPSIAISAMVSSVVLAWIGHAEVSTLRIIAWLGAVWLNAAIRLGLYQRFNRQRPRNDELLAWRRTLFAIMGISGAVYGSVILLPAHEPSMLLFAITGLAAAGHIAGGTQSIVAIPPVMAISAVTLMAPLIWVSVHSSSEEVRALSIMLAAYLITVAALSKQNYRALRDSFRLRYENLDLAKSLAQRNAAEAQAREAAEAAGLDKTRFLAAASHDLRQPLHAMTMFVSALKAEALPARSAHLVSRIDATVDALQQQLDSLLDISRLDAGVITAQPRSFPVASLVRQVEAVFGDLAQQKGLRLRVRPSQLWIHADPDMVAQMLRNLVANAIRYTSSGTVLVAFRQRGSNVRLQVWDTGIGIPVDQQKEIFREFHQLGNPERDRTKGVGLGLAIVERLARLLETRVEVRSRVQRGSVFWFDVPGTAPALDSNGAPIGRAVTEPPTRPSSPSMTALNILVVEDDALVRESLGLLLQSWGHHVVQADDTESSLAVVRQQRAIDAIVTDFRLPHEQTALDVLAAIRSELGTLPPVLIITGETAPAQLRLLQSAGHQVLHKPVATHVLRKAIAKFKPDRE
jgi:signal transduction histidine kinase/ActR/RegA family two-component response regulator